MKVKTEQYDVGVIVGRFQVPELHDAHVGLIEAVCQEHNKVVIFLGLSELKATRENPLDFEARKQMLLERFPHVNILYIPDMADDVVWSKHLDKMISHVVTPVQSVVLYGGRDSFVRRYHGKYPTLELESEVYVSGNEVRKAVSRNSVKSSADFRAGVVWASFNQYPTAYTTVDVAVFNHEQDHLLVGRKADEKLYRLIGGFSSPDSPSFEADARREVQEEAGIAITDPVYIGSYVIDDWRYRGEVDKSIKTLLFFAKHLHGAPRPDDDIAEVRWLDVVGFDEADIERTIMPEHRRLVQDALKRAQVLRYH